MDNGVQRQAQAAELFFLALPKGTSDLATLTVVDAAAKAVAQFGVVEQGQHAAAEAWVIGVAQDVDRFGNAADLGQGA